MRVFLLVLGVVAALALVPAGGASPVVAGGGASVAWESDWFQSPTGNIRCRYFYEANPLLACITLNDDAMVGVRLCCKKAFKRWGHGNRGFPPGPTLRYGDTWRSPREFKCRSYSNGMECWSLQSGHGFAINRAQWVTY